MDIYFSWNTKKNENGTFSFTVVKNTTQHEALSGGSYCKTEIAKTGGGFKTRAQAKGRAAQWLRYFRSISIGSR